ncbi:hypothetical protein [Streptomyces sp. NPDC003247]|uniref:hypothetical protein n=1 Tax=Streptomyces sp. NPDC003247 TaxID=3364677 RepID=UPI0036C54E89
MLRTCCARTACSGTRRFSGRPARRATHTEAGDEKVRARGGTPDSEQRLRKQVRRLTELRAADAAEIAQLKADVEALVGALHQATAENQLPRQQMTDRTAALRPRPLQRQPEAPRPESRRPETEFER